MEKDNPSRDRKHAEEKTRLAGYSSWNGRAPIDAAESDQRLVRMAQRGDAMAVSELYVRYQGRVLNYLYRFTGSREAAEDLTQETFVRVVKHLGTWRPTGSVAGWIFRIAKNLALNGIRDRKESVSLDEPRTGKEGEEMTPMEIAADARSSPAQEAGRVEMEEAVQKALLHVPPVYREAVVLCDIQGAAYKEAAEILGCPIDTVASRLARGRAKLAELLGYLKQEKAA
ncbi:MAG: sigma-70 family RNA polymerase sigma factor [Candidatus Omnitrophica bacterium]|nr:sigma-70 family RNA polymerase sigma factor [Candidatus Omnitrophota bacterium]